MFIKIQFIVEGYTQHFQCVSTRDNIRLKGPEDTHLRKLQIRRSRDLDHASLPLAQTPWGLTGRAWL